MPTWPAKIANDTSRAVLASRAAPLPVSQPAPVNLPSGDVLPGGPQRGWLIASILSLYIIWGSTYLAIRWALEGGMPPFQMSGVRFVLAGALLFAVLWLRGAPMPTARQWGASALVGLLLLGVGNGGLVFAQQSVPSGVAALVVGSLPLWTALFGGLFGQWPGRAERWGLAVGFGGIVLLNLGGDVGGGLLPTLAMLVSPMSWALGSVWSRRLPMPQGLMSTAAQMLCGGVIMLVFSLLIGERPTVIPTSKAVLAFFYLVVFGSLVGYSAYGYLLRNARPSLATSYAYVNPVLAVFLGGLLAGETMTPTAWLAMGAILGAVVLLTREK
ncbi:drug/metabolite exporter YedA [Myxococcus xanthus]|uniref:Drug/metabolite exporter YedA n=1 Tax=Myxococcus xanthus TaxID=34 RepID=A0A7Y4IH50_MYXXA|nr:drug/metabolite exporter YedA [Myxococcus xanthus]NOJ79158.1 drug/metabolite exporter YedA [Myxococcus xanthus]NOJ85564.1 drug/metabolite exporter YedA [Myxococcus xanthus]